MKVADLRTSLASQGQLTTGLKDDLVKRMMTLQITATPAASAIPMDVHEIVMKSAQAKIKSQVGILPFSEQLKSALILDQSVAKAGFIPTTLTNDQSTIVNPTRQEINAFMEAFFQTLRQDENKTHFLTMTRGHVKLVIESSKYSISINSYVFAPTGPALVSMNLTTASKISFTKPNAIYKIKFGHANQPYENIKILLPDLFLGVQWMKTFVFGNRIMLSKEPEPVIEINVRLSHQESMEPFPKLYSSARSNTQVRQSILKKLKAIVNAKAK